MDLGTYHAAFNALVEDTVAKARAQGASFAAKLDLAGRLYTVADGQPASAEATDEFRRLLVSIAADGVLTDHERGRLMAHLEKHGLTLETPLSQAAGMIDLDGITL